MIKINLIIVFYYNIYYKVIRTKLSLISVLETFAYILFECVDFFFYSISILCFGNSNFCANKMHLFKSKNDCLITVIFFSCRILNKLSINIIRMKYMHKLQLLITNKNNCINIYDRRHS